jgi:MFS transporter, ACS family, D-galactonate transporter
LYSASATVTDFIVNRVQTRWALLVEGLIWALTQFPMLGTVAARPHRPGGGCPAAPAR